jgi:hypothetical protein
MVAVVPVQKLSSLRSWLDSRMKFKLSTRKGFSLPWIVVHLVKLWKGAG